MYDASYLFWGIWKCVSPFIDEGTMQKVCCQPKFNWMSVFWLI